MAEIFVDRVHTEDAVLDIGGEIGALIIYTAAELHGREIELSPKGSPKRVHTDVHERLSNGRTLFAAVYPELREGEYDIWGDGPDPVDSVTIVGGEVATVDWR